EGSEIEGLKVDFGVGKIGVASEVQHQVGAQTVFDVNSGGEREFRVLSGLFVVASKTVGFDDEEPAASNVLNPFQLSGLRHFGDAKGPPIGAPQVLFVFS